MSTNTTAIEILETIASGEYGEAFIFRAYDFPEVSDRDARKLSGVDVDTAREMLRQIRNGMMEL